MTKFYLVSVVTLCIWLGQICAGSDTLEMKKSIRDHVYAVGGQFVDDIVKMMEENHYNSYVLEFFGETLDILNRKIRIENSSKINVNQVKEFVSKRERSSSAVDKAISLEYLKILQSILSKRFPPERYNGVVNVMFICTYDYATTDEIQSALNYLYGIDTEATKTSFLDTHNIPGPTGNNDCPSEHEWYLSKINELGHSVGIRSQVIQDFSVIHEKFPCNRYADESLGHFVNIIQRLGGDKSKINACMMKESPGNWENYWQSHHNSKVYMEYQLEGSKSFLSARLPDETIRGIVNFKRATIPDTPIDEIEKALEYLYEDVPKADCPATERSIQAN